MDNNHVNPSGKDEEFQFTEDQAGLDPEETSSIRPSSVIMSSDEDRIRRRRNIILIIVLIVGLFCIYKLYGLFSGASSNKTALTSSQLNNKPLGVKEMPSVKQLPAAALSTPAVNVSEKNINNDSMLANKITPLETAIAQNKQEQENLQNQISGLSTAMSEIQNNISVLTQQIKGLSQIQNNRDKLKHKIIKHKINVKKNIISKPVYSHHLTISHNVYYVKSIIQGRAWLTTGDGATMTTVDVRDELAGYGMVNVIDPEQGTVQTSSGKIINFMPQDR